MSNELTLLDLPNELLKLIFEHCESTCAIFLAMCNKQLYNLSIAEIIDTRFILAYCEQYDKIIIPLLEFCPKTDNVIIRWFKEDNWENLKGVRFTTDHMKYMSLALMRYCTIDSLMYAFTTFVKLGEEYKNYVKNFLVYYLEECGRVKLCLLIKNYNLQSKSDIMDEKIANIVVDNFYSISEDIMAKSTHPQKRFRQINPPSSSNYVTIARTYDYNEGLIEYLIQPIFIYDTISEKISATEDVELLQLIKDNDKISRENIAILLHACFITGNYRNYEFWCEIYGPISQIYDFLRKCILQSLTKDTPASVASLLVASNYTITAVAKVDHVEMMEILYHKDDSLTWLIEIMVYGAVKCLKYYLTLQKLDIQVVKNNISHRSNREFLDIIHENCSDPKLDKKLIRLAIMTNNSKLMAKLLSSPLSDENVELIISNQRVKMYRKFRKFSGEWSYIAYTPINWQYWRRIMSCAKRGLPDSQTNGTE